ncbi:MAG: DNA helicase RecQ [Bacteroidales bacterium]|nr:DNA helicase RecQ [Bacteroidales bacterium]
MKISDEKLKKYLHEYFGFDTFIGKQKDVIINLLDGQDTFVLMPTGGGKSLCYQLPALIYPGTAIIISPLIALMKNQVDSMRAFSASEGIAHFMNSSLNRKELTKVKEDILQGRTKMLYVAPESLTKEENIDFLKQLDISFYAIDEAHCISEWGHDFRPEYRRIRPIVEEIQRKPIIALTATATPKVQHDILKNLDILDANVFKSSFFRANLYYEVKPKVEPEKQIIKFIKLNSGKSGIIYCLSRKKVEQLAETLQINGIAALPYHAGLDSATRTLHQDKFLNEEVDVVVATIAFGMGIDKPDIRFVIHYDMPKSLEGYYQETGRAGRDNGEGVCMAYYSYKDIQKLEKFLQGKPISEQEIGKHLILETVAYAESSVCRAKMLLNYLGEILEEDCGNCDNCLNPRPTFDGRNHIVKIIKTLISIKEKFNSEHIAKVIAGVADSAIKTYKHDKIKEFGIGKGETASYWDSIIRQAMVNGFVTKDIENYGHIRVTPKGSKFLETPGPIKLSKPHDFTRVEDYDNASLPQNVGIATADQELFNLLKDLRRKISKQKDVPPFVIFQDPSLLDMAIQYPITTNELKSIVGVSEGKAIKYGEEFIYLIKKYVDEKEIERPQDFVIKSVPKKSSLKIHIIQSIDRKVDFENICDAKQIDFDDLLTEIEAIINSGTKINIDYYINNVLDEDKQFDIWDYFDQAETDSVDVAVDELGEEDFSPQEIRLMRIKYIADKGH